MNEAWYDKLDEINHNYAEKPMIALGLLTFGVLAPFYVAYRNQQQEESQQESPLNKDEQRDSIGGRMASYVDLWSSDDNYKDRVCFLICDKESCNHDIFEKYNVKATPPTFLFIKNNKQVAPSYILDTGGSSAAEQIETIIDGLLYDKK
ncbi:unnamed protein product [Rotaria sordida]|uniref:Thioredoxin domain-containing protein n=1 Tax=Rotaria sordida TaxID=392033 RepID=A0A819D8R7_9BILA|nr:unnamed protein product [Rotaria sordida]CAF1283786.1 unnamed protein product [Rotaria sordida]CAF1311441.1 unnamed protein product [Rotaria sordida]CAF1561966.1 unnamed protein product [Rotaria sordida]CAF3809743.1 unnamed protein product [Rotaria sordida]